jgi:hypothetical protein
MTTNRLKNQQQNKQRSFIHLGLLDVQVKFRIPGDKTIYITTCYGPSKAIPTFGSRECYGNGMCKPIKCATLVTVLR